MQQRDSKQLGLSFDPVLHKALKVLAATEEKTMTELLEEAVRRFLNDYGEIAESVAVTPLE